MAIFKRNRKVYGILLWLGVTASLMGLFAPSVDAFALSEAAWTDEVWQEHCRTVRTTYNPDQPLNTNMLTITANDPRFVDFLYWVWSNKIIEHQVEQLGGTGWAGPMGGVIFHWAPGSHWEMHTLMAFDHAIHHVADEHHWQDNMFKDFFERFGPVTGVNISERLSMDHEPSWANSWNISEGQKARTTGMSFIKKAR